MLCVTSETASLFFFFFFFFCYAPEWSGFLGSSDVVSATPPPFISFLSFILSWSRTLRLPSCSRLVCWRCLSLVESTSTLSRCCLVVHLAYVSGKQNCSFVQHAVKAVTSEQSSQMSGSVSKVLSGIIRKKEACWRDHSRQQAGQIQR